MAESVEYQINSSYIKKIEQNMQEHEAYENSEYEWSKDDFELGAPLGKGKFGRVFVAREKRTKYMVALKTLFKSELQKNRAEKKLAHEIEIQSHLKHPNILRLFTWFHDETKIFLVLELASEGELYRHLQLSPNGRFAEERAARYIYQVADALNYCHLNNVIHRDLKPENLLLSADDQIKLADFGWSIHTSSTNRKTLCGTLDYLPPEMVEGATYGCSVDQWCLGILCYEFVVGNPPFESRNERDVYNNIRLLNISYPEYLSTPAKSLISNLLKKKDRMSLVEVMKHPWTQSHRKIIE